MKNKTLLLFLAIIFTGFMQKAAAFLPAPELLSPYNGVIYQNFQANLSVRNVTGATGYQFQYDTSFSFNSAHLRSDTTSRTWFYTKDLYMGKKYYWRARAFKQGDTSDWSWIYDLTVYTKSTLGQPTNNSTGGMRLFYGNNAGSFVNVTYFFEADTSALLNSSNLIRITSDVPYFTDSNFFKFGRKVYWRMRAANSLGDTLAWSDTWSYTFTTKPVLGSNISNVDPEFNLYWPTLELSQTILQVDTSASFNSPLFSEKTLQPGTIRDTLRNLTFGRRYYYRIRAKFGSNLSEWSDTKYIIVATNGYISSPYSGEAINALTASFSWGRLDGSYTQFQLYRDSLYTQLIRDTALYNSSGFQNLQDSLSFKTKYYFRIRYYHDLDTTPWLNRMFQVYGGRINLSSPYSNQQNVDVRTRFSFRTEGWATAYVMEIDTGLSFPSLPSPYYIRITSFTFSTSVRTAYADTSLLYGKNYSWRVYAIKGSDTTEYSYPSTFTTKSVPVGYFPYNNMIGIGTSTNALVTGVAGSSYIQWQLDTSSAFESEEHYTGVAPHVPDDFTPAYIALEFPENLLFDAKYYWRARCINAVDTSAWSVPFNFTTTTIPYLSEPANNTKNLALAVTLKWSVQGSASDYVYQYQVSTDSSFTNSPLISLTKGASAEAKINCLYETKYYWRARAFHVKDTSIWSETFNFTTKDTPVINRPALLNPPANATNLPLDPVTLAWSTLANVTGYEVQIASDSAFEFMLTKGNAPSTGILFSGLQQKSRYYWRVRGKIDNITGPWSLVRWFETKSLTGLKEENSEFDVSIAPNPAREFIQVISAEKASVEVYNSGGMVVYADQSFIKQRSISTVDLPAGIYVLLLRSGDKTAVRKIGVE